MISFSYNISSSLKDSLLRIEHFRKQILLSPLPPKTELQLKFEAMVNRLYWSLVLAENSTSKSDMVKLLTHESSKGFSREQKEVLGYKKALTYISQEWLASPKAVTPKTVTFLHDLANAPGSLKLAESRLKPFLEYLQVNPENPIIQAGLAQIELIELAPFTDGNGRTARLLGLLFLYKYGYDARGLLVLEEYFRRDLSLFKQASTSIKQAGNATSWLEYFAKAAETQLEKAATTVLSPQFDLKLTNSFWELNDRQKEVISRLEEPGSSLTNKKVQKLFKVSQITASRDLTKLAVLGLVFPHGKGRSVFYTRV